MKLKQVIAALFVAALMLYPALSVLAMVFAEPSWHQSALAITHGAIASCFALALLLSAVLFVIKEPIPDRRVLWMAGIIAVANYTPAVWFLLR